MPLPGPGSRVPAISRYAEAAVLAAIVAAALALRLYNQGWDGGHLFHPDERFILMVTERLAVPQPLTLDQLLRADSTLNPGAFAYGSFPFYLLRFTANLMVWLGGALGIDAWRGLGSFDGLSGIGRAISALFDVGTVLLVYILGRRLYRPWTGLLGAAFVAFAATHVQLSHFYATDTLMTFLVVAALVCSAGLVRSPGPRWPLLTGLAVGLALATKVSSLPVLGAVGVAYLLRLLTTDEAGTLRWRPSPSAADIRQAVGAVAVTALAAIAIFAIAEPYAIIDFRTFVGDVLTQSAMVNGTADVPYTRQYADRPAYLYFLENLTVFGLGLPLGITVLAGWLFVAIRAGRRPTTADVLLLAWVVPYFAITGSFHAKFLRYLLPITPVLCLFAAEALVCLREWLRRWRTATDADGAVTESAASGGPSSAPNTSGSPETSVAAEGGPEPFATSGSIGPTNRDGSTSVEPVALVSSDTIGDGEGAATAANRPLPDDDAARWAELKGLGLFEDDEQEAVAAPEPDPIEEETRRWAELKGLSLDFGDEPSQQVNPDSVATSLVVTPTETGPSVTGAAGLRPAPSGPGALPRALTGYPLVAGWLARGTAQRAAEVLVAVLVVVTALWAVSYLAIYTRPHTAVTASRWIYANVPTGSGIAIEHWEEGMPVPLSEGGTSYSAESQRYTINTLNLYEDDTDAKVTQIAQLLARSDYVVFFSNRLYGTIPRLPQRYPMTSEYYRLLFGEQLGYKLVAAFTSYPTLDGIAFADDTLADPGLPTPPLLATHRDSPVVVNLGHADESFSVYDHPKVLVFQKIMPVTEDGVRALLAPALARYQPASSSPVPTGPETTHYKSLMLDARQTVVTTEGGTFRDLFDRTDFANRVPLLVWVLLAELVGLAAAPIAFVVLPGLADRGYLLSKTLGLLGLAWLSWIGVSLGVLPASSAGPWIALALLLVGGGAALYWRRREIAAFAQAERRLIVFGEVLFWAAFALFLVIRLSNPDLWHPARGGEKPMDLAYLMAAIKSASYPPYDPWFAGGYLNYYYFGQILVGTFVKLTGVLPTTAYNLVIPLLFALTAAGSAAAAYNLAARGRQRGPRPVLAGVAGAAFVCVLGNLGGGGQILQQLSQIGALGYESVIPLFGELVQALYGAALVVVGRQEMVIPTDWYWASTRVIPGTINEFPFFTFLYADLHAHMIGLPLTLLVLGLAISAVKGGSFRSAAPPAPADGVSGEDSPVSAASPVLGTIRTLIAKVPGGAVLAVLVTGLAIGALFPTNSWDLPTYLGVYSLAMLVPWYLAQKRSIRGLVGIAVRLAAVAALAYGLYLPFHANFQSFYNGVDPISDKSPVANYLLIHGFFLAAILTYVFVDLARRYGRSGPSRVSALAARWWFRPGRVATLYGALVRKSDDTAMLAVYAALGVLVVSALLALLGMQLVGLLLALLALVAFLALRRGRPAEEMLLLILVGTGLALGIGTELVALQGDIGRMNTVFKFYMQVWVLWGISSAVGLTLAWDWLRAAGRGLVGRGWQVVLAVLLALTLVYPLVGTAARVQDRFDATIPPTLDGTAYMAAATYVDDRGTEVLATDRAAIQWMQDNVPGSPVVLEGWAPLYHWGARVSIYTGLPTVIGWDWHQKQQRWGYQDQIDDRIRDVGTMLGSPSPQAALDLMHQYRVAYVYVGDLERAYYPADGLAKFDRMVGTSLDLVYNQNGVKIYRVRV